MGISSNATKIEVVTAAKNGTLAAQGTLNANQILFDTNISTNNSNLMASPTFVDRVIVLREGELDEEVNLITAINVDGVTADCHYNWVSEPVSGDTYHVAYVMDDVATVAGCTFDTTSREFVFDRIFQVGQNTANYGLCCAINYQHLRISDEGLSPGLSVVNGGAFHVGTHQGLQTTEGASIVFTHDGDTEECMQVQNGGIFYAYDFAFESARAGEGVTLEIKIIAGGVLNWGDGKLIGITAPMTKGRHVLRNITGQGGVPLGTVKELNDNAGSLNGWCTGDMDESVLDAIAGQPDNAKVYLVVEELDT